MSRKGKDLIVLDEPIPPEILDKHPELDLNKIFLSDIEDCDLTGINKIKILFYTLVDGKRILDIEIGKGFILRLIILHIERIRKKDRINRQFGEAMKNITAIWHCVVEKWVDISTDKPYINPDDEYINKLKSKLRKQVTTVIVRT